MREVREIDSVCLHVEKSLPLRNRIMTSKKIGAFFPKVEHSWFLAKETLGDNGTSSCPWTRWLTTNQKERQVV